MRFERGMSEEIRELERDADRNSDGLGEIWTDGEYLDHHPIPQVLGGDEKGKEERPIRKEEGDQNIWKLN